MANVKNKVLFLLDAPLNQRDFERRGIKDLTEKGFETIAIDLSPFSAPSVYRDYSGEQITPPQNCLIYNCNSLKQAIEIIQENSKNSFCFIFIGFEFRFASIYKTLNSLNIPYGELKLGSIPYEEKTNLSSFILNFFNPSWYLDRIYKKYKEFFSPMKPLSLLVIGGEKSLGTPFPISKRTEILNAHAMDYDLVLKNKDLPLEKKHLLFIDEYQPFHPDFERLGVKPPSPENYYLGLCNFFKYLEGVLKKPVVVAAHPRSRYNQNDNWFQGRLCIKGKTEELIRGAEVVLVNASTATKIAIAHKKPIISLTSDELEGMFLKNYIHSLSQSIGSPLINVDSMPYNFQEYWVKPNLSLYEAHMRNFIKTEESANEPIWETVSKTIPLILKTAQSPIK